MKKKLSKKLTTPVVLLAMSLCGLIYYFYAPKKMCESLAHNNTTSQKMRKFIHNKLWRDKGPVRMEATGSIVHVTILDDEQYSKQLGFKLMEEAAEVHEALNPGGGKSVNKKDLISEIGDVLEVLDAIIKLHDLSRDEIIADQTAKRDERGGLYERKFVTMTESIPGTYLDVYCSKDPLKYKEILD